MLAAELKIDPAEIRLKNFVREDEFPFATATGLTYDSGDYEGALRKALGIVDYEALRREQAEARAAGKLMGIGISTYGEICAFGPSAATPAGGWESATVKVEPSGQVTVLTGTSPHGQGQETSFAQIAADELGVAIDNVVVLHGDTAVVQYGIGTFGSRNTAVGGAALYYALQEIKTKMKRYGEMLLDSDDVTLAQRPLRLQQVRQVGGGPGDRGRRVPRIEAAARRGPGLGCNALLGTAEFRLSFRRAHRGHGDR